MNIITLLFILLSAMAVGSAIMMLLSKNPVKSILWLIVVFFAISGHYIMLNAQFLAIVNIIVYAGAIMVLFLFVVMLMNLNTTVEPVKNIRLQMIGVVSGGSLLLILLASLMKTGKAQLVMMRVGDAGLIKNLGNVLFTNYVLPFEIASVLFLSAMVGAVQILGKVKVLKVQKGFSPKFFLGELQLNKVGILGEKLKGVEVLGQVFNKKNIDQVTKLYKTYKTGLIVFKVLGAAGTAVTTYSVLRGATGSDKFDDATVKKMLTPAIASIATGVLTKVLTKAASYKAVDIFNGVVKRKVQDIFSIQPASSNLGIGLYVKL
ncbi:MAG: NADH-quinone oxidoreductase subunit J [Chitinophagaceae bacterium]|nr:MAG: NADH-quinone oxidoreductase subunit J [Chitinophagaceae bacterium]